MSYKDIHIDDFNGIILTFKRNIKDYKEVLSYGLFAKEHMYQQFYTDRDHITPIKNLFYTSNKSYLTKQSVKLMRNYEVPIQDAIDYLEFVFTRKGEGEVKRISEREFLKYLNSVLSPPTLPTKQFSFKEELNFKTQLAEDIKRIERYPNVDQEDYVKILFDLYKPPYTFKTFRGLYFVEKKRNSTK